MRLLFSEALLLLALVAAQGEPDAALKACPQDAVLFPAPEELGKLSAAAVPAEEAVQCPYEREVLSSQTLGRATRVTFENHASVPVQLFWVSGEGEEVNVLQQGYMVPGQRVSQVTYEGHVFVMRSAVTRELLVRYTAGAFVFEKPEELECGEATPAFFEMGKKLISDRKGSGLACSEAVPKSWKNGSPCRFNVFWMPRSEDGPELVAQMAPFEGGDASLLKAQGYHNEFTYLTHAFAAILPSGVTMDTKVVAPVEATDCSLGGAQRVVVTGGRRMAGTVGVPHSDERLADDSSALCDPVSGICGESVLDLAKMENVTWSRGACNETLCTSPELKLSALRV